MEEERKLSHQLYSFVLWIILMLKDSSAVQSWEIFLLSNFTLLLYCYNRQFHYFFTVINLKIKLTRKILGEVKKKKLNNNRISIQHIIIRK